MHKPHKFETCSADEMYKDLMTYSRARFHATKKRFSDNLPVFEKLIATYERVKEDRKDELRHTKYRQSTRPGRIWLGIHNRLDPKHLHKNPTYSGCKISENFKDLDFFYNWCYEQKGFLEKDDNDLYFDIDKDILGDKNNKIYSEDVCVFVPKEINSFVKLGEALRGDLPIGVALVTCSGKFKAQFGKKCHGVFDTAEDASAKYKEKKEERAKFLAEKWKDKIDSRVYEFLKTYKVDDWI